MNKKNQSNSEELKKVIINAILDKKGEDLVELDLKDLSDSVADSFIICHGNSNTQVGAIANSVYKDVKNKLGLLPKGMEGKGNALWIILDYFDVVVHIFYKETRNYYQLEELWSDAMAIEH